MKNENKGDEMIDILTEIHKYVPRFQCGETVYDLPSGQKLTVPQTTVRRILFGGDQLTTARVRGAKRSRANSLSTMTRFEEILPAAAYFHTFNLLDVRFLIHYNNI